MPVMVSNVRQLYITMTKTIRITLRINEDLNEKIKEFAEKEGKTVSGFLQEAALKAIESKKSEPKLDDHEKSSAPEALHRGSARRCGSTFAWDGVSAGLGGF